MPATTQSQQRLFAMALSQKRGKMKGASKKVKELAKSMPEKKLREFAKTKRSSLKENYILNFTDFVNEAYVDDKGELKDFELSPTEKFELSVYDSVMDLIEFLKDAGAKGVGHTLTGKDITFDFEYGREPYSIYIDLDSGKAEVFLYPSESNQDPVYSGDAEELILLIRQGGLDSLRGY